MRRMLCSTVDIEAMESRFSPQTKKWLRRNESASTLYKVFVDKTNRANSWYDDAEDDESITRWVPSNGSGDCYLIYPAECLAAEAWGTLDSLRQYAYSVGRIDVGNNINDALVYAIRGIESDE